MGESAVKMEKKVFIVCFIVGFLGIVSTVLGLVGEHQRIKITNAEIQPGNWCEYPKSPLFHLGLSAAISLMMAQAIMNTASGFICCKRVTRPADGNWTKALISFTISWMTFLLSFILLLTGAVLNHEKSKPYVNNCYVVIPGIFAGGAVLAFITSALEIFSYYNLSRSKSPVSPQLKKMGRPVIPQRTAEPVFVPEGTL